MEDPTQAIHAVLYRAVENEKRKAEINRKVSIIAWLLPRFRKGISDPKNYEELIGKVDE